jgi:hypothetical protein
MEKILGHQDPMNVREVFPEIEKWLKKHGCNVSTGRFAEYAEFLHYLQFCEEHKVRVPKYNMLEIASFHREIFELAFVFTRFTRNETDVTTELIKKILQGHALPTNNPEAEKCRNYLLQLRAAAYFLDSSFEVLVNSEADVIAKKDGKTYYVECKRIYSLAQVDKRFGELRDQLLSRLHGHIENGEAFGIAWIDPTSIFLNRIGMYSAYSRIACQAAVRMDLHLFTNDCPFTKLQKDSRILAVMFQMVWPSITAVENGPFFIGCTSIIQPLVSQDAFRDHVRPLFDKLLEQIHAPLSSQS